MFYLGLGFGPGVIPGVSEIPDMLQKVTIKPTDQSVTNSTAVVDDADFQFVIGANETWCFEIYLHNTQSASFGIKAGIVAPVGATGQFHDLIIGDQLVCIGLTAALGSTVAATLGSTILQHVLSCVVVNGSTAGIVKLQWAQFSSGATATVVKANSYMVARKIP